MGWEAAGRQKHMEAAKVTVDEKTKVVTKWAHNKRVEVSNSWCGVCLFLFLFVSLGSARLGVLLLYLDHHPRTMIHCLTSLSSSCFCQALLLTTGRTHPILTTFQYPRFHPRFEGVIHTWSHTFPLGETSLSVSGSRLHSVTNTLGAGACQQEFRITLGKSYSSKMS